MERNLTSLLSALVVLPSLAMPLSASENVIFAATLDGGTRVSDLTWRTEAAPTGNGVNPPFTATWNDITTAEATVGLSLRRDGIYVRGEGTYGRIIAGTSSISAFADDTRDQTTYRSDQRSDGGDTREGLLALGLIWSLAANTVQLGAEAGYTHQEQHLTLTDGEQITPATGAYPGLDSHYRTRWKGPWIGVTGAWTILGSPVTILANGHYQMVDYRGELDFNLRSDLAHPRSIEQSASGFALALGAGVAVRLTRQTEIHLLVSREESRVEDGYSRVNYSTGLHDDVPLKDVILSTWILRLGLRWEY